MYTLSYEDRSFTYGDLATEKITIGSFKLNKTVIGCGHMNSGSFSGATSGIIELDSDALSLLSQMSKIFAVKRQFSQSKLRQKGHCFRAKSHFYLSHVKRTRYLHYLTLEAMSVANKRFKAANDMSVAAEQGNILMNFGTTLTILPSNLYKRVALTLARVVKVKRVHDSTGVLDLCFVARSVDHLNISVITTHFSGDNDVKLLSLNIFAMVAK
ncbi:aspartic proteinase CDR1-like [Cucurbita moschata]|uniref:Aspartic proteinase CDR1-like n=1 Tax=Cucurbita moschata TaxID=3662 RepID=A0A6J1FQ48_CUCMO|nr:aspartic proteinase CDR1-like [Cucurbita moschata]